MPERKGTVMGALEEVRWWALVVGGIAHCAASGHREPSGRRKADIVEILP